MADLISLLIGLVIQAIIIAPVLWLAGKFLAKSEDATIVNSFLIVFVGTIVQYLFIWVAGMFNLLLWLAPLLSIIIWLFMIKKYFKVDWIKALLVAILAGIIAAVLMYILSWFGI